MRFPWSWSWRRGGGIRAAAGFTLLELLVVLAVITLLVAIAVPALAKAKGVAMASRCLSNQRQLGISYHLYAQDYGQLPGINRQIAWTSALSWGQQYFHQSYYGGNQAWWTVPLRTQGLDDAAIGNEDYLTAALHPEANAGYPRSEKSSYSGIGYVQPYVPDGKVFYCPGNPLSFDRSPIPAFDAGGAWVGPGFTRGRGLYETWTGEDATLDTTNGSRPYGFGKQGAGTLVTYTYRSSEFARNLDLPDTDPDWADPELYQTTHSNYTSNERPRLDNPSVENRSILSDWWLSNWKERGQREGSYGFIGRFGDPSTLPHARDTNVLFSDGHARTWRLPDRLYPIGQPAQDVAGRLYEPYAFEYVFQNDGWPADLPFWWVLADRALR